VQTDAEPTPGTPKGNPTPGFHGNVGKSNMAFNEDEHPYFIFPAEDAKKIKASFEYMKISEPDYKVVYTNKKATLEVSTWADTIDLEANIKSGKIIVDKLGVSIKIRPHVDIKNVKNPEYLIDGVVGDQVVRKATNLKGFINNTFSDKLRKDGQLRETVKCFLVFDFKNATFGNTEIEIVAKQLWAKFNSYKKVDKLYLINDNKAVKIDRKIIKQGYESFKTEIANLKNYKSKA
jgi:hypothetical protein